MLAECFNGFMWRVWIPCESGFKLTEPGRTLSTCSCPESFIVGIGCTKKELLYPQQEFLKLRWCLFPWLLGTLRGEGSEEGDVLKEIPPKGWKKIPVRTAFSRKLGFILFSMFPGVRGFGALQKEKCDFSHVYHVRGALSQRCQELLLHWNCNSGSFSFCRAQLPLCSCWCTGRCWMGELSGIVTLLRNYAMPHS